MTNLLRCASRRSRSAGLATRALGWCIGAAALSRGARTTPTARSRGCGRRASTTSTRPCLMATRVAPRAVPAATSARRLPCDEARRAKSCGRARAGPPLARADGTGSHRPSSSTIRCRKVFVSHPRKSDPSAHLSPGGCRRPVHASTERLGARSRRRDDRITARQRTRARARCPRAASWPTARSFVSSTLRFVSPRTSEVV